MVKGLNMEEYDGYEGSGLDLYHLSDILDSLGEDYITLWPLKRIMIVKRTTGAKENNFRASNLTIYNNILMNVIAFDDIQQYLKIPSNI